MALTYSEYPFLKELGLEEENLGVYNGKWGGSGDFLTAISPTTGKPIAKYVLVLLLLEVCAVL